MRTDFDAPLSVAYRTLDDFATDPRLPADVRDRAARAGRGMFPVLAEIRAPKASCAFWPGPELVWYVGDPEEPHRVEVSARVAPTLRAAHLAIRGPAPRWQDAAPSLRTAHRVRAQAVAWAMRHCPQLVPAFDQLAIRGGRLCYTEGSVRVISVAQPAQLFGIGPTMSSLPREGQRP